MVASLMEIEVFNELDQFYTSALAQSVANRTNANPSQEGMSMGCNRPAAPLDDGEAPATAVVVEVVSDPAAAVPGLSVPGPPEF
jgi:hypothetical protein